MPHDVFISYSSKDKPAADAACNVLERNGVRCWMAPRDIVAGTPWAAAIVAAIRSSKVMLLVFSSRSNRSEQVAREVVQAINAGIAIVPFRIEDTLPSASMEYYLGTPHWLDAFPPPMEQHLHRLTTTVRLLLGQAGAEDSRAQAGSATAPAVGPAFSLGRPWYRRRPALLALIVVAVGAAAGAALYLRADRAPACDAPAQSAETDETRVKAFRYIANEGADPAANVREWSRPEETLWIERTPKFTNTFKVRHRARVGRCDGTVVAKEEEPSLELFISDRDCEARKLMFRRRPSCDWLFLPPMEAVE